MAFANKVVTANYGVDKNILIAPELATTLGAVVANTGITANSEGKKIIKAGTPLKGDLKERNTAFAVAGAADTATCVCLHDVDVTNADQNATIVISGTIDLLKLDSDVAAMITSTVIGQLNKITFVKGAK